MDRKQQPRGKSDLGHLVDQNAVLGQLGADRLEEADLRRELVEAPAHLGLPLLHLGAARWAAMRAERIDQAAQDRRSVADQRDRRPAEALRLLGIGIDADDREVVVDAPLGEAEEQPGADAEHHIGLAPQFAAERQASR